MKGAAVDVAAAKVARRGLLLLDDLRAAGISDDAVDARVKRGMWKRRASGLYELGGLPADWRRELLAAQLAAGPTGTVARLSAAAYWGIPGFPEGPVDVVSSHGTKHNQQLGFLRQSCLLPEAHVVVVDGIRVTRPSRTLFDIAALIKEGRLERGISNSIAMRLTSYRGLVTMLDEVGKRGRPGTAAMRRVLGKRAEGRITDSGLEVRFLDALEAEGLPIPECQVWLGDDDLIGRVDYFWRPWRLVGEVDSDRFHTGPMDAEADAIRDARLRAAGFEVIRFPEDEIRNRPRDSTARLRAALAEAA